MAKKKTTQESEQTTQETSAKAKASPAAAANSENVAEKQERGVKREPQLITPSGDKITNAHVYKSNRSDDDWFFTAKINGIPLKPQLAAKEDVEKVLNKSANIEELMNKYYPSKMQPKLDAEAFKIPFTINTPEGEKTVHKFNAYKEKDMQSYDYGKYRFFAQIGDQKMSTSAPKAELNAYFDRTLKPADIVSRVFGERLHLADYYKQFRLPDGVDESNLRIVKNKETSRYEVSAKIDGVRTPAKELSYDDRSSYFNHHTASKEQLGAKYLNKEISQILQSIPKKEMKVEQPQLKF